ncbi:polysaccharide biosynthesis C-terminal domain-containing protein [Vibrio lentus]|nr:polysaccharide biosynthesis C-terminal domain-containing protein [Vibrio lentus]
MVTNMVFNAIFAYFYGYVGLAIATALSAFVNMTLLYRGLHLAGVYRLTKTTLLFSLKLLISGTVMIGVIIAARQYAIVKAIGALTKSVDTNRVDHLAPLLILCRYWF